MTGGSFAAILINIPGSPSASATTMDGFPLTQKGEAGRALGVSIVSSFTGGIFSFFCLLLIAPQLTKVALQFRAADLFGLVFFGMSVISAFAAKSLVKGLLSTFLGLMIVTVGMDPLVGTARFTFGDANMLAGIHFIACPRRTFRHSGNRGEPGGGEHPLGRLAVRPRVSRVGRTSRKSVFRWPSAPWWALSWVFSPARAAR